MDRPQGARQHRLRAHERGEADGRDLAGSLQESSGRQHLSQPLRRQRGTWTEPAKAVLPNNNSPVQFTRLQNDHSAIVFNDMGAERASERRRSLCDDIEESSSGHERPAPDEGQGNESRAFWGAPRAPLTLAISRDEGQTWPKKRVLEVGDDYCMINNSRGKVNREFSYALVKQTADGDIHIAFTYLRQKIKYVRVTERWVEARPGVGAVA